MLRPMQSLRDKLLKAGLITEQQAKSAPAPAPAPRAEGQGARAEGAPRRQPEPGSPEYQRLQSKLQLETDRRIRELVLAAEVPVDIGATVFHFMTRKNRLRRLQLTEPQAKKLEN